MNVIFSLLRNEIITNTLQSLFSRPWKRFIYRRLEFDDSQNFKQRERREKKKREKKKETRNILGTRNNHLQSWEHGLEMLEPWYLSFPSRPSLSASLFLSTPATALCDFPPTCAGFYIYQSASRALALARFPVIDLLRSNGGWPEREREKRSERKRGYKVEARGW